MSKLDRLAYVALGLMFDMLPVVAAFGIGWLFGLWTAN